MISRVEFYISVVVVIGIVFYLSYFSNTSMYEAEKAKLEARDSLLTIQRDSALAKAMMYDMKSDSLTSVINRKKLDIDLINKKYEKEKNSIRTLDADSTLRFFKSSVQSSN